MVSLKHHVVLRQQPFAAAKLRDIVTDTYLQLKQRHVDIQRTFPLQHLKANMPLPIID